MSIPEDLLKDFDRLVKERGYVGRSEALRDAMRLYISQNEWDTGDKEITASLNIVYAHKPKVMADLIEVQHTSDAHVISAVHIHISKTHCLEVITLSGSKQSVSKIANAIAGITGIEYSRLFIFTLPDEDDVHTHVH